MFVKDFNANAKGKKLKSIISLSAAIVLSLVLALSAFQVLAAETVRVSFWETIESVFNPGFLQNPQTIADSIDITPVRAEITDTKIKLPEVPEGFRVKIAKSSEPELLAEDGTIKITDQYHYVTFQYEVTRLKGERKAYTKDARVLLPAKATSNESNLIKAGIRYEELRSGIFFHTVGADNGGTQSAGLVNSVGVSARGIADYCAQMNVDKVVQDVSDMGVNIVFITDFHGLGTTLHPSAAIDYWRGLNPKTGKSMYAADRDLIGEFITKLKAKNIYTVLFTHPLDGHDFSSAQQKLLGFGSGDMAADKKEKERTTEQQQIIDELKANKFQKWNDFINDVYADIMARYGKDIVGIGFDSAWGTQAQEKIDGVSKLDIQRLKNTITSFNKDIELISLGGGGVMPTGYLEEIWRPFWHNWKISGLNLGNYDYNTDNWPAYTTPVAAVINQHWTTTVKQSEKHLRITGIQMFRYAVMQYGSATEGPATMWATTPYVDGSWQADNYEALMTSRNMMLPIKESLDNTLPSTSYTISKGTQLKNLPNGISATRSKDGAYEYIHVLNAPAGNVLSLPAPKDGKVFTKAVLLASGTQAMLSQTADGVTITLPAGETWNQYDTVFKLTVQK